MPGICAAKSSRSASSTDERDTFDLYLTNASTCVLAWPEQLEAFAQLPPRRAACWSILLESRRFALCVLQHVAQVAELEMPVRWTHDATRFYGSPALRNEVTAWCLEMDPYGDVLHEVISDLGTVANGATIPWIPENVTLKGQHLPWLERCCAALRELDTLRGRIATSNLGLGMRVASGRRGQGGLSFSDLTQETFFGLLRAVDRFDPARGLKFSTYASWWVRQAVNRAIQNTGRSIRIPVHLQQFYLDVRGARTQVGKDPDDIAKHLGVPVSKVTRLSTIERTVFFLDTVDRPVAEPFGRTLVDTIVSEDPSPFEVFQQVDIREQIRRVLSCMPGFEAEILRRRFGIDGPKQTLSEIGQNHSLSRERIRQIEQQAFKMMREIIERPPPSVQTAPVKTGIEDVLISTLGVLESCPRVPMNCSKIALFLGCDAWVVRRACTELSRRSLVHRVGKRFMWLPTEFSTAYEHEEAPLSEADKAVLSFLEHHPAQTFARTAISREIGIPVRTVRISLGRLCRLEAIQQVGARFQALRPVASDLD